MRPARRERHPLRVGLKLAQDAPIESYRRVWKIADEAGFDHCWAFDHLASIGSGGESKPLFEGWALLAAMAQATVRTRVGLLVTGMAYRPPALLAKAATTVDHLSGGRLEFGIGAGYVETEHQMFGIELGHDAARLSEGLQVIKLLWTEPRSSFEGRHYRLHDAVADPKPVQQPHPPIWIGAGGPLTLRIAALQADVWNPAAGEFEAAVAAGAQLDGACAAIGRDPNDIRWSTQLRFDGAHPASLLEESRRWREAGFSELVVYCAGPDPVRAAEVAAESVLPTLRA